MLIQRLPMPSISAAMPFAFAVAMTAPSAAFAAADPPAGAAPSGQTTISPSYSGSASTSTSSLDPAPPPPADHPRRPWFGGLGYVSIAPFFGEVSALESGLRAPEALGESYGLGDGAFLLGGGGGAILFGHLWLGGHGYGLLTSPFDNARGKAVLTGGGGAFELGYALSTAPKMLFIPFFGLGGFAYNLDVTNQTTGPMPLLNAFTLSPGESKDFTSGFAMIEAGVRVQRLMFTHGGGMSAGLELGVMRSLNNGPWLSGHSEFTHEEGAALNGVYARVNIGGGGFAFR